MRVAQAGHALRQAQAGQRGARAIPDGKTFPWPRSACKATRSGHFRYATTEIVGSWPSPSLSACKSPIVGNSGAANSFRTDLARKKSRRCDLLHKGLRRLGLNHHNGSENPSIIVRLTIGHRHRLCLGRHRRSSHTGGAGLPDPDLTSFRTVCAALSNIEYVRAG